jgi:hypothetical protein
MRNVLLSAITLCVLLALTGVTQADLFFDNLSGEWSGADTWTGGFGLDDVPKSGDLVYKTRNVQVTVAKDQVFSGGTWSDGTMVINDGQTLTLDAGTFDFRAGNSGNLLGSDDGDVGGEFIIASGARVEQNASKYWTPGKEVKFSNRGEFHFSDVGESGLVMGEAIFANYAGGKITTAETIGGNNRGIQGGVFRNEGGTIEVADGKYFRVIASDSGVSFDEINTTYSAVDGGTLTLGVDATMRFGGTYENLRFDTGTAADGATASTKGGLGFVHGATLDLGDVELVMPNDENDLRFDTESTNSLNFTQAGKLKLVDKGKLEMKNFSGGNRGVVNWSNEGQTVIAADEVQLDQRVDITNRAGGVLTLTTGINGEDELVELRLKGSILHNEAGGTIVKNGSASTGAINYGGDFDNDGTIRIENGNLYIDSGSYTDSGEWVFVANSDPGMIQSDSDVLLDGDIEISLEGELDPAAEYLLASLNNLDMGTFSFIEGLNVDSIRTSVDGKNTLVYATPIPEPATMSLLALGGLGVLIRRRRS